jgi:hypothetical protein
MKTKQEKKKNKQRNGKPCRNSCRLPKNRLYQKYLSIFQSTETFKSLGKEEHGSKRQLNGPTCTFISMTRKTSKETNTKTKKSTGTRRQN